MIEEELEKSRTFILEVRSQSMLPLIRPRDLIRVKRLPWPQLCCGDIVVFRSDQEIFTHRLISKKTNSQTISFIAKGDNCFVADRPVMEKDYLGKVISLQRDKRTVRFDRKFMIELNRVIGLISFWEAELYGFLRKVKRSSFKN
ncbi:MAG: signal peptidase I [Candidatus Omnitrophica bacterium]|nr:signal peptidase I [Candidatus Omnitrophota bacterium]